MLHLYPVPEGSTASKRLGTESSAIHRWWYKNPVDGDLTGGPPSGFVREPGSVQTHNVIETIPSDDDYSPLWVVYVYDNADFDKVYDLISAKAANILREAVMNVNCPTVFVGP